MARIVNKLDLNKTPQNCEDYSLVFAKNVKVTKDGSLTADSAFADISYYISRKILFKGQFVAPYSHQLLGQIVGINNKIYFFTRNFYRVNLAGTSSINTNGGDIGSVTANDDVVISADTCTDCTIIEYDEITKTKKLIKCNWTYSGGIIHGCVTSNNTNQSILVICEYKEDYSLDVPIKYINLSTCNETDDESIYTQTPNIPISNLECVGTYTKQIPAGVYQFFIRYKINDKFYTEWIPCSKELYAGTKDEITTIQGSLKYIDKHKDSFTSFIFELNHINNSVISNYTGFQLGFILSHDDGVFARSWKDFSFNINQIYFDYDNSFIQEINIDDLLKSNFEIFNVKNLIYNKNKLYISNYKEGDVNPDFTKYASRIKFDLGTKSFDFSQQDYFNDKKLTYDSNKGYYTKVNDADVKEIFGNTNYNIITRLGDAEVVNTYNETLYIDNISDMYASSPEERPYRLVGNTKQYLQRKYGDVCLISVQSEFSGVTRTLDVSGAEYNDCWEYRNIMDDNISDHYLIGEYKNKPTDTTLDGFINASIPYIKNLIKGMAYDNVTDSFTYVSTYKTFNNILTPSFLNTNVGEIIIYYTKYNSHTKVWNSSINAFEAEWTKTTYRLRFTCKLQGGLRHISINNVNARTLLPFTTYKYFIHFIKPNGIYTNGYEIKTTTDQSPFIGHNNSIDLGNITGTTHQLGGSVTAVYPIFKNMFCPEGYVGAFISIEIGKEIVCKGLNYQHDNTLVTNYLDCIELDTLIYNINENIIVVDSNGNIITREAKYYASSDSRNIEDFGNGGYIKWSGNAVTSSEQNKLWIILCEKHQDSDYKKLIKLTPYFKLRTIDNPENASLGDTFDDYDSQNIPGFISTVYKLDMDKCRQYYVSGNDVYEKLINKKMDYSQSPPVEMNMDLTEQPAINIREITTYIPLVKSTTNYVWSNYNLEYMSLSQDLQTKIRQFIVPDPTDPDDDSKAKNERQMINSVDSLISNYILELQQMYKSFTRKTYANYNPTRLPLLIFDNTVRSSNVNVDEQYKNIYKFNATDYYNLPTNRGIIVKLFTNLQNIYVHCEHTLYEFSSANTMQAENEQVLLQENDVFNTGVKEIFNSEYGRGGIQNKEHCLITDKVYIFYDALTKTLYGHQGGQELADISSAIYKLLEWLNPVDVHLAYDFNNDRFFINFGRNDIEEVPEGNTTVEKDIRRNVCLSFNFTSKAFASIHDFDFNISFYSRNNCYFAKQDTVYSIDNNNIATYKNMFKISTLICRDSDFTDNAITNPPQLSSCVDIIFKLDYETVKVLNYINWICNKIVDYDIDDEVTANITNRNERYYYGYKEKQLNNKAEEIMASNSLWRLRVYSDSCITDLINWGDSANNIIESYALNEGYKAPIFNYGVYSFNYFRNQARHYSNTSANYSPEGAGSASVDDRFNTDNTLMYGKYFVARFVFMNEKFKLENITFNTSDYDKVKSK